jgi:adenosine deaminase CECR1
MGREFPVYLHCGETNDRTHQQLYDAILLDTKRIGHGFHLAYHPELMKIVKDKGICIECCPVSNLLLGYVLDLRCHPARGFLHAGLPVSISPDDPGFMGYEGVTLDYLYVFLAWELDIADLKQLCLNSIIYSSISDEHKKEVTEFFNYKWNRFLDFVIGKY